MQSDGNSFCGDVVLDGFNEIFRDEDNILDSIYKSKNVHIIIMMASILYNMIRNNRTKNPIVWVPCCYVLYLFEYAYSSITLKIKKKLYDKVTKIFACHILSKMLSSSLYVMLKLSKTTSPQKLFPSDCITLYHICTVNSITFEREVIDIDSSLYVINCEWIYLNEGIGWIRHLNSNPSGMPILYIYWINL